MLRAHAVCTHLGVFAYDAEAKVVISLIENQHNSGSNPMEIEKNEWRREERKRQQQQWLTIASPIFLLALWELLSRTAIIDPRFFPPPTSIIRTFWSLSASGELLAHIGVSMKRILLGFLAGTLPGIVLGLLIGMYRPLRAFFSPLIMALMPIPTLALMPLIMIVFGIGEVSKVVTIAGSVFFPVVLNTAAGVVNIDRSYIDVAKNYGANPVQFFWHIAFPGALPVMMEGIQMGQAIALLTIVAAEMIGANEGIGYLIWSSYKIFNFQPMYVGLILISFFGFSFSLLLRWLQRRLVPWQ
jgi:NitT/TauT family transport system permease protein